MLTWFNSMDGMCDNSMKMVSFHDYLFMLLIVMVSFVGGCILTVFFKKFLTKIYVELEILEFWWTMMPIIMLFFCFFPSLSLLYYSDEGNRQVCSEGGCVVKISGRQWYWEYSYDGLNYTSVPKKTLGSGQFRLLDVSIPLFLEKKISKYIKVNSDDVIHSFAVPSLGLKIDAVPARTNEILLNLEKVGVFFGQCSEICGALHSNMPMKMVVSKT